MLFFLCITYSTKPKSIPSYVSFVSLPKCIYSVFFFTFKYYRSDVSHINDGTYSQRHQRKEQQCIDSAEILYKLYVLEESTFLEISLWNFSYQSIDQIEFSCWRKLEKNAKRIANNKNLLISPKGKTTEMNYR